MRPPKTDITFTPEDGEILAYFTVPQAQIQAFINHLNARKVFVQPPQPGHEVDGASYYQLELVGELDEASAQESISTFMVA